MHDNALASLHCRDSDCIKNVALRSKLKILAVFHLTKEQFDGELFAIQVTILIRTISCLKNSLLP